MNRAVHPPAERDTAVFVAGDWEQVELERAFKMNHIASAAVTKRVTHYIRIRVELGLKQLNQLSDLFKSGVHNQVTVHGCSWHSMSRARNRATDRVGDL